jgi:uncharacterized iron-regulated membrane protein
MTGTAPITQDWKLAGDSEHAEHMGHDMGATAGMEHMNHAASLDVIVASATAQNLAAPVLLTPPSKKDPNWWAKSDAQNRPARADVALSAMTGDVLARKTFGEKHIIDQIVGVGIAVHEGQLFAPLNQVLGVLTALGLITLCISAFVMWRRRAPEGVLGAPPPIPDARIGWGLGALIVVCAVLLPVLGISLVIIGLVEWIALRRLPVARKWLGLPAA